MAIRIGLGMGAFPFSDPRAFWRWVDLCEQSGVDSLWQTDRLASGQPFLDVDDNGKYEPESGDTAVNVAGPGLGNQPCDPRPSDPGFLSYRNLPMSVPHTCDGRWGRAIIHVSRVLPVEVGSP